MSSQYVVQGREPDYRKSYPVKEKQTGVYSFTIRDEAGLAIAASQLTAVLLTLHVPGTGAIVNSRENQDVLNDNQVTISEAGLVTWTQQVADMTIQDTNLAEETHRALFYFTWQSGGQPRSHPHEVEFVLENLDKLT